MIFINRYTKPDNQNYNYSQEFIESNVSFILAVGQTQTQGLISKIDSLTGNIIWEKKYNFFSSTPLQTFSFKKIIRTGSEATESRAAASYYFVHATLGNDHYIISVNINNGDVIWCKKITLSDNAFIYLEPVVNDTNFYLGISVSDTAEKYFSPLIGIFDPSGTLLSAKSLELSESKINAFKSFSGGIILATRMLKSSDDRNIISLTTSLAVREAFEITSTDFSVDDISIKTENEFDLVGSYSSKTLGICKVSYKSPLIGGSGWTLFNFSNLQSSNGKIQRTNSNLYILEHNSQYSLFHKLLNNTVVWTKKINVNGDTGVISHFLINNETDFLNFTVSNSTTGSLIGYCGLELVTCKTESQTPLTLTAGIVGATSIGIRMLTKTIAFTNVALGATVVTSTKLEYCPHNGDSVDIDENTMLQSPNFYLQTAGSTGEDSTKGIHARWIFRGALGEKHLPKGNLASNTVYFNKTDDFVNLYRTPYFKVRTTIDFSISPQLVDNANKVWIYRMNNDERVFYVYFRNNAKYDTVRQTFDPLTHPLDFIRQYGQELIEIENKKELFFAGDVELNETNSGDKLQLEGLSVSENTLMAAKTVSFRKTFVDNDLQQISWKIENGRSIRFKSISTYVTKVHFEFYADFISAVNVFSGWNAIGEFSLSQDDIRVYSLLEPEENLVNGRWLRYNDGAYVNTDNYKDKWSRTTQPPDRNLKQLVNKYITLSNNANNPKAFEQISLIHEDGEVQPGDSPDDSITLSNLDLLRVSSYDFHMARMLGLGIIDYEEDIWSGDYIYLAEYYTLGDLEDGEGAREVHHLSMSLPTSIQDQRLPLPVELNNILPGAFVGLDTPEPSLLTDEDGYTFDGKQRYVTLYSKYFEDDQVNPPFYNTLDEFDKSLFTYPVYSGIEYRKQPLGEADPGIWEKPEISHDSDYMNVDTAPNSYETIPILLPESPRPLYVHNHTISGTHFYDTYGINWFSRATAAEQELQIETLLRPRNLLSPPYEINPFLIVSEMPLMFTSQEEQIRLNVLENDSNFSDKTLIRIPFYYDIANELLDYKVPAQTINPLDPDSIFPDEEEIYAKDVELFFRNSVPMGVSGKAINVTDHTTNPLLSIITTGPYTYLSNGEQVTPNILPAIQSHFIGGLFVMGNTSYIIHGISSDASGNNPTFTVFKKEVSDGIILDTIPTLNAEELLSPVIEGDGLFHTAENMQNEYCWNAEEALLYKVKIGDHRSDFEIHRELVYKVNDDGVTEEHVEKSRGFWENAEIEEVEELIDYIDYGLPTQQEVMGYKGLYKITFNSFKLAQHSQFSEDSQSVEWWNGNVRLFTENSFNTSGDPIQSRKLFKVSRTENIGTNENLVLYIEDPLYEETNHDKIKIGNNILVNYYPGYKAYLYSDAAYGITETAILPNEGEGMRYSVFGLRSVDTDHTINGTFYKSKISIPAIMFAREYIGAETPEQPEGSLYATRPDYFGRSTYTFTTKYAHKPFGLMIGRSNDEILLNALYEPETVMQVRENLDLLGGQEELYFTNRWQNFLDYEQLKIDGEYGSYPPEEVEDEPDPYQLPLPDKKKFFQEINQYINWHNAKYNTNIDLISETSFGNILLNAVIIPNLFNQTGVTMQLIDFVQNSIYYSFIPLTEMPVIYQYIPGSAHQPVDEKQVVKDENGYALPPNDERFKMAPMMKTLPSAPPHRTLYTDFHLDGYSKNFYFYGVREVSSQMKIGEFSKFLGPVKLVNSNPPEAPEVKRIMPVLANPVLGVLPHIQIELNAYPKVQNIRKINVYRTFDPLKAKSIRSMDLIKVIDLEDEDMLSEAIWTITDYFEDLPEIRYGDGIYYRLTVSRKIEYAKADYDYGTEDSDPEIVIEYAPSQSSKIVATLMMEVTIPSSPNLSYTADILNGSTLENVILKWDKQVYNGKYHLYKMNAQGNWVELINIQSNDEQITLPLENTSLETDQLVIQDNDGNPIYHHFKVLTENTAGMFSTDEIILTIPNS